MIHYGDAAKHPAKTVESIGVTCNDWIRTSQNCLDSSTWLILRYKSKVRWMLMTAPVPVKLGTAIPIKEIEPCVQIGKILILDAASAIRLWTNSCNQV